MIITMKVASHRIVPKVYLFILFSLFYTSTNGTEQYCTIELRSCLAFYNSFSFAYKCFRIILMGINTFCYCEGR